MPEIGLTGGIGSGKSTVAMGLAKRGAVLIEADAIVRQLQTPGKPVFEAMVRRWGKAVVTPDGTLDRVAVAAIVFNDAAELAALNAVVHPAVEAKISKLRSTIRNEHDASTVVVLEIPLLLETNTVKVSTESTESFADKLSVETRQRFLTNIGLDGIVTLNIEPEIAIKRLIKNRGHSRSDILARIAAQTTHETRLSVADFVINNNGSFDALESQIEACWLWACSLKPAT